MSSLEKGEEHDAALRKGLGIPVLLRRLHRSLVHPVTLAQCCGGRSKSVPSLFVQRLVQAESSFHLSDLQESHEYVMTRMIPPIHAQLLDGTKPTSLPLVEQLQCLGRFLEFLLEYPNHDGTTDNNIPSMILQLMRACSDLALTKTVDETIPKDLLNQQVEVAPVSTALRIWLYTTLLRLNQYCHRGRPFLLSMTWKTLANLSTSFRIPAVMLHQAQSALLQHLQDGLSPILQSILDTSDSTSPPPLLWKIVGFLLARWTVMAQATPSDDASDKDAEIHPTTAALPTLVLLRGLYCWATNFNNSNQSIVTHIDASLLLGVPAFLDSRMSALCAATMPSVPECRRMDVARVIWEAAWMKGKGHILTNYLKHPIGTTLEGMPPNHDELQNRIESLLTILEEMLFIILPSIRVHQRHSLMSTMRVQDELMVEEVMESLVHSLVWMETRMTCSRTNVSVDQLHRVLIHWMSRAGSNAEAAEDGVLIASMLSRFWSSSSSQKAFQQLLLELFWDARTTLHLRSQISMVILRVVQLDASSESLAASVAVELWSGTAVLLDKWPSQPGATKKRKRHFSQTDSYRGEDWHVICSVLSALPPCQDLPRRETLTNAGKISLMHIRRFTLHTAVWHCGGMKTGLDHLMEPLLSIWTKGRNDNNVPSDDVLVWTVAVLRQIPRYFDTFRIAEDQTSSKVHGIAIVIQLLAHCTASVSLEKLIEQSDRSSTLMVQMILEAIQVLGTMGTPLSYSGNGNPDGVQSVSQCFHRLLSSNWWSLRSYTMTAFLHFASTLPVKYKSILPQCVPGTMQSLLQARLQKKLDYALIGEKIDMVALKQQCMDAYVVSSPSGKTHTKRRQGPIFPTQSYTLPAGSYCLTLPTQEGRSALVIFPPGPDSLLDLQGMLGDAEEENQAHQLRHNVVLSCGNALKETKRKLE